MLEPASRAALSPLLLNMPPPTPGTATSSEKPTPSTADGYLNYLVRERVFGNINDFVAERSQAQEERLGAGMWSRAGAEDPCVAGYP